MHGLHLTADLQGCRSDRPVMTEPAVLRDACLAAVRSAGLHAVGELFHRFEPAAGNATAIAASGPTGVTGVVLLAESHLAVHTWPELGQVTLDVYVCNRDVDNSGRAEHVFATLLAAFDAAAVERHRLERGAPPAAAGTA